MILMNDEQKLEFQQLKELLLNAGSKKEIDYFSEKIHLLLDNAEEQNSHINNRFNEKELKVYYNYKQKLLDAEHIADIQYYENKIMNLIEQSNKKK